MLRALHRLELREEGLELVEVAPGIDLQEQVLALMPFEPAVLSVRPMPDHVFRATERMTS